MEEAKDNRVRHMDAQGHGSGKKRSQAVDFREKLSREPPRLDFLRVQETETDHFKFQLWHKLIALVQERMRASCEIKHQ